MSDTTTRYVPRDYRRVCDICGMLRNISEMHKQDELWVCTYDAGERVRTELDRGNARQRPFTIKPVPYPKPQNYYYPNTLEADEGALFAFIDRMIQAQCRFESIISGAATEPSEGFGVQALSWAGRYLYDLIQANARPILIPRAKVLLGDVAAYLLTRQYGSATGPSPTSTRASDAFYGGVLEVGADVFYTDDVASSGLALLYAYRVLGTVTYLIGARAAASYLRNVQAIGSNGTNYTSSDSAGTSRLYTGALASQVSTASGFYSDSRFYPRTLIALEFWSELKTTDGDQSIGTTGTPTGFASAAATLMSTAMADLRSCWETGITDTTGALVNGFSTTSPAEFFNAYPLTKTHFGSGSGSWEWFDGSTLTGTAITSQTFARAVSALYNYEGATAQVTAISDWLRTFADNTEFNTPANTSTRDLYRSTTGTFDPTVTLTTLLTVRDAANGYASITTNGSSLYDWGAFGLMSRIWASRNKGSFLLSRLVPLNVTQRFFDGTANDGNNMDRVATMGLSGLTMQTGYQTTLGHDGGQTAIGASTTNTTPPLAHLQLWVKSDRGITLDGSGNVAIWADQSGQGNDLTQGTAANRPTYVASVTEFGGAPGVKVASAGIGQWLSNTAIPISAAHSVYIRFNRQEDVMGRLVDWNYPSANKRIVPWWGVGLFPLSMGWIDDGNFASLISSTTYLDNQVTSALIILTGTESQWYQDDFSAPMDTEADAGPGSTGITVGALFGGMQSVGCTVQEFAVYDTPLDATTRQQLQNYIAGAGTTVTTTGSTVNDALLAAQFGRSFRESRQ